MQHSQHCSGDPTKAEIRKFLAKKDSEAYPIARGATEAPLLGRCKLWVSCRHNLTNFHLPHENLLQSVQIELGLRFCRSRGRVFFTRLDGYQTDISESQVQSAPAALLTCTENGTGRIGTKRELHYRYRAPYYWDE
jgi:hypothetical protein